MLHVYRNTKMMHEVWPEAAVFRGWEWDCVQLLGVLAKVDWLDLF